MAKRTKKDRVFISYSHRDGDWVVNELCPVLKAGGVDLRIDLERFRAGRSVLAQMDDVQDSCGRIVLVLSPDYVASDYCMHELQRAVEKDPEFGLGNVIPVLRRDCKLPSVLRRKKTQPLYVKLHDESNAGEWDLLMGACEANIGADVPVWLKARRDVCRTLDEFRCVNLVVSGRARWRRFIEDISSDRLPDLGIVDLNDPETSSRNGLLTKILSACNLPTQLPRGREDLVAFGRTLRRTDGIFRVCFTHFDVFARQRHGTDVLSAIRYYVEEVPKLVLLVQSKKPASDLLPADHILSPIQFIQVRLPGSRR